MIRRSVGRPRKMRLNFFSTSITPVTLLKVAKNLAACMPEISSEIIDDLAATATSFQLMSQLQKSANLIGKGSGRRATIHVGMLYAECALIHEKHSSQSAHNSLKSMGGWEEESRGESCPQVVKYVKAILEVSGVRIVGSQRQQVRNSLKYLGISPLFHAVTR